MNGGSARALLGFREDGGAGGNTLEPELDSFLEFVLEIGHVTPEIRGWRTP